MVCTGRKLIEKGVEKSDLAGVMALVTPIAIILPPVRNNNPPAKARCVPSVDRVRDSVNL